MNIVSLKDAKAAGLKRYYTGKACKQGHLAERRVGDRACVDCGPVKQAKHYWADRESYLVKQRQRQERNREACRQSARAWKDANREVVLAYARSYRQENAALMAEKSAKWRAANPDRIKVTHRDWVERNRGVKNSHTAARLAHVKRATPKWLSEADVASIRALYEEAARLTAATGTPHQVDHIVPLRGRFVSGLHVPGNLQILPARDNLKKGNRFNQTAKEITAAKIAAGQPGGMPGLNPNP